MSYVLTNPLDIRLTDENVFRDDVRLKRDFYTNRQFCVVPHRVVSVQRVFGHDRKLIPVDKQFDKVRKRFFKRKNNDDEHTDQPVRKTLFQCKYGNVANGFFRGHGHGLYIFFFFFLQ